MVRPEDEKFQIRYTRQRIKGLMRGAVGELYEGAVDSTLRLAYAERVVARGDGTFDVISADSSSALAEKIDIERALAGVGLTDRQRAMAALLAMGWSITSTARILGAHHQDVRRLVSGVGSQPGLAARIEAFLNGEETP